MVIIKLDNKFRQANACKAILLLHKSMRPMTIREISKNLHTSESTMTYTMKKLSSNNVVNLLPTKPMQFSIANDSFSNYVKFISNR